MNFRNDICINRHNTNLYIDGIARPDSEKGTQTPPPTDPRNDRLQIGNTFLDGVGYGNIWMDELIIWQQQIPPEDVIKLYQAYQ